MILSARKRQKDGTRQIFMQERACIRRIEGRWRLARVPVQGNHLIHKDSLAGCAVIISHDRFFLDRLATHMLAFDGDSHPINCAFRRAADARAGDGLPAEQADQAQLRRVDCRAASTSNRSCPKLLGNSFGC